MIAYIYSKLSSKANDKKIDYVISEIKNIYQDLLIYSFDEIDKINKDEIDYVLFSGGDGSFNYFVNYFYNYLDKIIFGYIPMGTANDIGKNLNIKSIKDAIDIIRKGNIKEESLLEINDKLFMYGVSIGTMSNVSINAKRNNKKHLGKLVYKLRGIRYLFKKKDIININGKDEKLKVAIIARTKYLGGVRINKIYDNNLYLYKIKNIFSIISLFIFGRFRKHNGKLVNNIEIKSDSIWCIDGEKIDINRGIIRISDKKIKMLSKNA